MKHSRLPCLQAWAGGILLSFFLVTGMIYAPSHYLNGLLREYIRLSPVFVIAAVAFAVLLQFLSGWSGPTLAIHPEHGHEEKRVFITAFCFFTVIWAVYIGAFYPGTVSMDAFYQIDMTVGTIPLNDHHPISVTMYYGFLFSLGRKLLDDRFGIFLITLVQSLMTSAVFALCVREIWRMGFGRTACLISALFYGLNPIFGVYAETVAKDALYYPLFTLFFLRYIQMLRHTGHGETVSLDRYIRLGFIGLLLSLIRHDGFLIVTLAMLLLILLSIGRQNRVRLLAVTLAALALFTGYKQAVGLVVDKGNENARESLSLPARITAIYMKTYPSDVTAEEFAAIDKVMDGWRLAANADPLLGDKVKDLFREDAASADIAAYLKVWLKMFLKHPACYIDGLLHCTFGYYYPFFLYMHDNFRMQTCTLPSVNFGDLDVFHLSINPVMQGIIAMMYGISESPWLQWIFSPGTYTWIYVAMFVLVWKKRRWRELAAFIILIAQLGICMLSPVNGNTRYALPLIAMTPLVICWALSLKKTEPADPHA